MLIVLIIQLLSHAIWRFRVDGMRKLSKYNHFTNAFFLSFCTLDFAFAASSGKCGFAPLNKEFSRFDTMVSVYSFLSQSSYNTDFKKKFVA